MFISWPVLYAVIIKLNGGCICECGMVCPWHVWVCTWQTCFCVALCGCEFAMCTPTQCHIETCLPCAHPHSATQKHVCHVALCGCAHGKLIVSVWHCVGVHMANMFLCVWHVWVCTWQTCFCVALCGCAHGKHVSVCMACVCGGGVHMANSCFCVYGMCVCGCAHGKHVSVWYCVGVHMANSCFCVDGMCVCACITDLCFSVCVCVCVVCVWQRDVSVCVREILIDYLMAWFCFRHCT